MTSTEEAEQQLEVKKASSSSGAAKKDIQAQKQYSQISKVDETVEDDEDLAVSIDPDAKSPPRPQNKQPKATIEKKSAD